MSLPKKNALKSAFMTAVAGIGLTGCAVVPYGPVPQRHYYYETAPAILIVPEHRHFEPRHEQPRFEPRPFHRHP